MPRPKKSPAATSPLDPDVETLRSILDDKASGKTRTGLARVLKVSNSAITSMFKGERTLKKHEVEPASKYVEVVLPSMARHMSEAEIALMNAKRALESAEHTQVKPAPVKGETAAGVWLEYEIFDEEKYPIVPYISTRYGSLPQFAFRVNGNSMDREKINDGDFVICVDVAPSIGDKVVVERRRGQLFERTCKILVAGDSGAQLLASRSNDPRYGNDAIALATDDRDGTEVGIVGVVVGVFRAIF